LSLDELPVPYQGREGGREGEICGFLCIFLENKKIDIRSKYVTFAGKKQNKKCKNT
jgi:hypothetical protein